MQAGFRKVLDRLNHMLPQHLNPPKNHLLGFPEVGTPVPWTCQQLNYGVYNFKGSPHKASHNGLSSPALFSPNSFTSVPKNYQGLGNGTVHMRMRSVT